MSRFVYVAGLCALLLATFSNYALEELGHDEGMYLGASYLAMDRDLYRELSYFQAPYLPLVLSRVFAAAGGSHLLLWGRLITFAHHALIVVVLAQIALLYTGSRPVSFLFAILLGLNGFLFGASHSIDNTTFASAYFLVAYGCLLQAHRTGWQSSPWLLASGFFVALAAGFKLTYLTILACFFVVVALCCARALRPFLLGSLAFDRALLGAILVTSSCALVALGVLRSWYLQPIAIVGALFDPSLYSELGKRSQIAVGSLMAACLAWAAWMQSARFENFGAVFDQESWTAHRYVEEASRLRSLDPSRVATLGNEATVYGVEAGLPLAPTAATSAFVRESSSVAERRDLSGLHVATFRYYVEGLEHRRVDMVIASLAPLYVRPEDEPSTWCGPVESDGSFDEMFRVLCENGFETLMLGEGDGRTVVFYRPNAQETAKALRSVVEVH